MIDKSQIEEALRHVFDERDRIDAETHRTHHAFVAQLIERQAVKEARREKLLQQVLGWGILAALSGMAATAYTVAIRWVRTVAGGD